MMVSQTLAMLLGIFAVALASSPGAETCSGETCAASEAVDGQDVSVGSSLLQAAMRPHKAERTAKQGGWSVFLSTKRHNEPEDDVCPTCGNENDPASCIGLIDHDWNAIQACEQGGIYDPTCLAFFVNNDCMVCHDCIGSLMTAEGHEQPKHAKHGSLAEGTAKKLTKQKSSPPLKRKVAMSLPRVLAAAQRKSKSKLGSVWTITQDPITDSEGKGSDKGKGKDDGGDGGMADMCPSCGHPENQTSCIGLVNPDCSNGIDDPACLASFVKNDCMVCHDCIEPLMQQALEDDSIMGLCPVCGDSDDPESCFSSCIVSCDNGPDDPVCIEAFTAKNCMACHDCLVERVPDPNEHREHPSGSWR